MSSGVARGAVLLVLHNHQWTKDFEREAARLDSIFGDVAVSVEHVGSTVVPSLSAKPIIDIAVGLHDFAKWQDFVSELEKIGYVFMPERVKADEVFMPKGPDNNRTHYLHITAFGSDEWVGMLRFRDVLRSDSTLKDEYETLKQNLARQFPNDRQAYSAAKKEFIESAILLV